MYNFNLSGDMFYLTEPNILFYMTTRKFFFKWNQHSLLKTASSKVKWSLHYLDFRVINLSSRIQKWFNENTIFYALCTVLWLNIFQLLPWKSCKTLFPQVQICFFFFFFSPCRLAFTFCVYEELFPLFHYFSIKTLW